MEITAQPEVLRPGANSRKKQKTGHAFDDENLDLLSHLLDDFLRVPGTSIRFGLDGIVGFIPGIGDALGGIASCILIVAAWSRGVAGVTIARMVLNVAIETVGGSIPVIGNLFDIGWKANRRNYKLLTGSLDRPRKTASRSWLVLAGACFALAFLIALPALLLGWLLVHTAGLARDTLRF